MLSNTNRQQINNSMKRIKELQLIVKMNERLGVATDQAVYDEIAAEELKEQRILELQEERKQAFKSTFSDLSKEISKLVAEEKQKTEEEQALLDRFANVLTKIDEIRDASTSNPQVTIAEDSVEGQQDVVPEVVVEAAAILAPPETSLAKQAAKKLNKKDQPPSMFVQPDPAVTSRDLKDIQQKLKLMEGWVSKISMAGPGGGEVNLRWLDDVARETIADGRWLKYDGVRKKFVFDDINPYQVVYNTTEVTGNTYVVQEHDYYIGVDYAGTTTVVLPVSTNSGRTLVIKDEDGDAETNPITVQGTVDNDPGGFVIQINNGAVQLIYRNGWRII
jgi:hypothetical protein